MASYDQLVKDSQGTVYNTAAQVAYNNPDQLALDLGVNKNQIQWGNIRLDPAYKLNAALSSSQLASQPTVNVPTTSPTTTEANSAVAGSSAAAKSYQDFYDKFNPTPTLEQQQASSLTADIQKLLEGTSGKAQALSDEEQRLGVPELSKDIAALNADLLRQAQEFNLTSADYDKLITTAEDKPRITMAAARGEQGRLARAKAAELNVKASEAKLTEARIAGKLGQFEQAKAAAQQAVDLRYAPILEKLDIKSKQLAALRDSGILDRQETAQAAALEAKYKAEQETIAEEKAKAKTNLDLALSLGLTTQFANRNGEFFNVRTGKTYANPQEFFADAGVKSFADAYQRGLISNIDNATILEKNQVGQLMAKYWDAGITMADSMQSAQAKLAKSRIYQKETYIASPKGTKLTPGVNPGSSSGDLDILAEAVSNKLGSVAAKNSFIAQYNSATTEDQKIKILTSNVVLPAEAKNGIIQNTQVIRSLDDVLSMLDSGVQTGLLQAGRSYIANKLGTGGDKQVEAIKSKLVAAVQPYRNKVTGAAWGDQEEAEYQALIGSVRFTPEDLTNKINAFKDTLRKQSQTALLAGIDPLGAINNNSILQTTPTLNAPAYNTPETIVTTPETQHWWQKATNWLFGPDEEN